MQPDISSADLVTDGAGRLALVVTRPGDGLTTWHLLATSGPGTLRGFSGTCVHAGPGDGAAQARAVALSALSRAGTLGLSEDAETRAALRGTGWPPAGGGGAAGVPGTRPLDRFLDVCGYPTALCATGVVSGSDLRAAEALAGLGPVDRLARDHPTLFGLLRTHRTDPGLAVVLACLDGDEPDAPSLASSLAALVGARPGDAAKVLVLLRRIGEAWVPSWQPEPGLRLACAVPADWLPSDADELAAFAVSAAYACALRDRSGGVLGLESLAAPAAGRWASFVDSLALPPPATLAAGAPGFSPGRGRDDVTRAAARSAADVEDMVLAFRRQVALPALACADLAAWSPRSPRAAAAAGDRLAAGMANPVQARPVDLRCWGIVCGSRGLAAVMERARDWHRRRAAMDREIRAAHDPRTWPAPFPPYRAGEGVEVVALTSAAELSREGAVLRHCVGGYADRCIAGSSVIVSVRRDGEPSSTAELDAGWRILQHRSAGNADPTQADAAILEGFVQRGKPRAGALERGRTRLRSAWDRVVRGGPPDRDDAEGWRALDAALEGTHLGAADDALAASCGYDWRDSRQVAAAVAAWSRFLPRGPLRGDAGALVVALGGPVPVLDRGAGDGPAPARAGRAMTRRARRGMAAAGGLACLALLAALAASAEPSDADLRDALAARAASSPVGCPADLAAEGVTCARAGRALVRSGAGRVEAYLVGAHPSVAVYRSVPAWMPGAWPAGSGWRPWLRAEVAGSARASLAPESR